jgi:regulatory protein
MPAEPAAVGQPAEVREPAGSTGSSLQSVADARSKPRVAPSLKGRALKCLARREYSRAELRRKLLAPEVDAAALDAVLDDLEAKQFLSDRRYAEVLARSKGGRYGVATLSRTLSQQGVGPEVAAAALEPLRHSERERALDIWRRRFGEPPADLKERARQHRFLLSRGFDGATVSWVLKQAGSAEGDKA